MAQMPRRGPSARIAKAPPQPLKAMNQGINWMAMSVSEKPRQTWTVRSVPVRPGGASSAMQAEN